MADAIEVAVLNTALGALGQEPVADLSDGALQSSKAAVKLLRHLETARDVVLARHGWVCALDYGTLSPATLEGYTNWRYPTVYLLPEGALRVWEIEGVTFTGDESCWAPRWQVGTIDAPAGSARKIIRAVNGVAQLNAAWVRRANWAALDPHVRDAVAYEVAARGAYSVTGERGVAADKRKEAEANVIMAISVDGTQEGGQPALAGSIPAALRNRAR